MLPVLHDASTETRRLSYRQCNNRSGLRRFAVTAWASILLARDLAEVSVCDYDAVSVLVSAKCLRLQRLTSNLADMALFMR